MELWGEIPIKTQSFLAHRVLLVVPLSRFPVQQGRPLPRLLRSHVVVLVSFLLKKRQKN